MPQKPRRQLVHRAEQRPTGLVSQIGRRRYPVHVQCDSVLPKQAVQTQNMPMARFGASAPFSEHIHSRLVVTIKDQLGASQRRREMHDGGYNSIQLFHPNMRSLNTSRKETRDIGLVPLAQ